MNIPKRLISNRQGKLQPMSKEQARYFGDNGVEDDDLMAFNDLWNGDDLTDDVEDVDDEC